MRDQTLQNFEQIPPKLQHRLSTYGEGDWKRTIYGHVIYKWSCSEHLQCKRGHTDYLADSCNSTVLRY